MSVRGWDDARRIVEGGGGSRVGAHEDVEVAGGERGWKKRGGGGGSGSGFYSPIRAAEMRMKRERVMRKRFRGPLRFIPSIFPPALPRSPLAGGLESKNPFWLEIPFKFLYSLSKINHNLLKIPLSPGSSSLCPEGMGNEISQAVKVPLQGSCCCDQRGNEELRRARLEEWDGVQRGYTVRP